MNLLRKINELDHILEGVPADNSSAQIYWEYKTLQAKLWTWKEYGMKTFVLSDHLVEAFQNTNISLNIYPTDFKYPFKCFTVESHIPLFKVDGEDGNTHDVYSVLYIDSSVINLKNTVLMDPQGGLRSEIEWDISLSGLSSCGKGKGVDQMWINMRNSETIDATYKHASHSKATRVALQRDETQDLVNIFYNTVAYINDPDRNRSETESHHTRKIKIGKGFKKPVKTNYILLTPPKNYKPLNIGSGSKIDVRFLVMGHYRNQAYGKNMSERKRIWIQPFWKGPDLAEVVSKPHKVE